MCIKLKRVHYPSGGYTDYFFETNRWNDTFIGGGLRIQHVVEHTGTAQAKVTYFDYDFRAPIIDPRDLYYKVYRIDWVEAQGYFDPAPEMSANFGLIPPDGNRDADMVRCSDLRIDAQMTSYSYDPMVDVTSMTDPSGLTTFYNYDELGRLEVVKDSKGNIVKTYGYHFKDRVNYKSLVWADP